MTAVFDGHIAAISPFLPRPLAGIVAQYAAYTELDKAGMLERRGSIAIGANVRLCVYTGRNCMWVYIEGGQPPWAYGQAAAQMDAPDFDVVGAINGVLRAMHATSLLRNEYMEAAAREVQKILAAGTAID